MFLAILFVAISLTDFFDGAVARAYNHVTWFGEILDPIADKALFYSVLISLVAIHKLYFYWAIILIGREFFVTTLRHIACQKGHELNVIFLAKVKTMIMMASLTVIILTPITIILLYSSHCGSVSSGVFFVFLFFFQCIRLTSIIGCLLGILCLISSIL